MATREQGACFPHAGFNAKEAAIRFRAALMRADQKIETATQHVLVKAGELITKRDPMIVYDESTRETHIAPGTYLDPKIIKEDPKYDISGLPKEEDGAVRTFANWISDASPSETNPDFVKVLRAIASHEEAVPLDIVAHEAEVPVEKADRLTAITIPGVLERHEDANGETWLDMPKVKEYLKKAQAPLAPAAD